MPQFRKKPVVIEAMQFDGSVKSADAICRWANDLLPPDEDRWVDYVTTDGETAQEVLVSTLEGHMLVSPGDWVIRGVAGEHYPCKPDIFAATYEPAPSSPEEAAE